MVAIGGRNPMSLVSRHRVAKSGAEMTPVRIWAPLSLNFWISVL